MYKGKLILASSSPRRKDIFKMLDFDFISYSPNIEENFDKTKPIEEETKRIAYDKAFFVAQKYTSFPVIGVDTIVYLNGEIMGKPKNREEAKSFLLNLSANKHTVYSGISLVWKDKNIILSDYDITDVYFKELTEEDISFYLDTMEWTDKAGGYAIQGKGALLVKRIEGDFYNVMGLPLNPLFEMLKKL